MAKYNEKGQEIPDPTPVVMPLGYERPESLSDVVARMVRIHISKQAHEMGLETFEEADDFSMDGDDEVLPSQYEMKGMEEERPSPARIKEAKDASRRKGRKGSKESSSGSGQPAEGVGNATAGNERASAGDAGVKAKQG